ncbi:MAG: hypothetical protein NHB32_03995 [Fischerella sp. CENA71]|nr:hypothetical protein [Fischerella sp. CENA71]
MRSLTGSLLISGLDDERSHIAVIVSFSLILVNSQQLRTKVSHRKSLIKLNR